MGFSILRKPIPEDRRILVILMLCGLAAFAVDGFFSFPAERIEHSLFMLLMAGIILGCYQKSKPQQDQAGFTLNNAVLTVGMIVIAFNLFMAFKKYNFEVHAYKAKGYEAGRDYGSVIKEVKAAKSSFVTLDPNGSPLENVSAVAYKELKDYPNALKELEIAKKYNPNSSRIYNNMGTVYTDMNDFNNAILAYQQALRFTPKFDVIYKNLAVNYFQLGNDSACISALKNVDLKGDQYLIGLLQEAEKRKASRGSQ